MLTIAFGLVTFSLNLKDKTKLDRLQQSTRTSMGLPRVGTEHPGVKYVRLYLTSLLLIILSLLPYAIFLTQFWEGDINGFPLCLTTGLNQLLPASIYLIYGPAYFMRADRMFYRFTVRTTKEMFGFM